MKYTPSNEELTSESPAETQDESIQRISVGLAALAEYVSLFDDCFEEVSSAIEELSEAVKQRSREIEILVERVERVEAETSLLSSQKCCKKAH